MYIIFYIYSDFIYMSGHVLVDGIILCGELVLSSSVVILLDTQYHAYIL